VAHGRLHRGISLNPSPYNYQDKRRFEADTSSLHAGAVVTCWYDPSDPARAYVVDEGLTTAPIIVLAVGFVSLGLLGHSVHSGRRRGGRNAYHDFLADRVEG